MHLYGCQQVLLHPDDELKSVLEFICQQANSLINCGIYYARQLYFKTQRLIGKYDLEAEYKTHKHFKALYSQAAQQILRSVAESFESFKKLRSAFYRGELTDRPSPPKYRKSGGLALVTYPKQALRLVNGSIRLPLGKQVKRWFGLDSFALPMPSNLDFSVVKELRILPRNGCFYAEFVYRSSVFQSDVDKEKVLGIDPGVNNWLTCVSNIGKSFIIDGRQVKSQNQWYNKQVDRLKTGKPQGFWNDELAAIAERRNRQMRDGINKAARYVINWCIYNRVGRIIFGWNQRNKDEINLGKKNNQEIVQIPTAKLKQRIEQLCQQYGIEFVETEESYTSKSSYLDGDELPTFGAKPEGWKPSGKRIFRGMYKSAKGLLTNCDCLGAANIIRKVAIQLSIDLTKVGRAVLILPRRINVFRRGFNPSKYIRLESPVF